MDWNWIKRHWLEWSESTVDGLVNLRQGRGLRFQNGGSNGRTHWTDGAPLLKLATAAILFDHVVRRVEMNNDLPLLWLCFSSRDDSSEWNQRGQSNGNISTSFWGHFDAHFGVIHQLRLGKQPPLNSIRFIHWKLRLNHLNLDWIRLRLAIQLHWKVRCG